MSRLSDEQRRVLSRHVADRGVYDLGAGDCRLSLELLELGARKVAAVDKERMPRLDDDRVIQVISTFASLDDAVDDVIEVAFLSWPANHFLPGLLQLLARAETVVYLGKNTDREMCGGPWLFEYLKTRPILDYVPHPRNCMIVYGTESEHGVRRRLVGEELAGISSLIDRFTPGPMMTFEQAEAAAAKSGRTSRPRRRK